MYNNLLFRNNGLKGCDEIYKWKLLTKFKLGRNTPNKNYADQVAKIKFDNLIYHSSVAAIKELATAENSKYNELLEQLFCGVECTNQRIEIFCREATALYEKCRSDERYQANQSERCAAALLTFYDPDKYTFFMPTFYKNLCKTIGIDPYGKGERYEHYLLLIETISDEMQRSGPIMAIIDSETKGYIKSAYLMAQDLVFKLFYQYYDNGFVDEVESQVEFIEGSTSLVTRSSRQRNRNARQKCIELMGAVCSVCGFDFEQHYGSIGKGYIHVHHKTPISERDGNYMIDVSSDLVPVCPNCHAMLHKEMDGKCLSVEELTNIVEL